MSNRAQPVRKHHKRSRLLVLAVAVLVVYVAVVLTQLRLELQQRQDALDEINAKISETQSQNEELEYNIENRDKYLEEQARQRGLARSGEIIFQEIPGVEQSEG